MGTVSVGMLKPGGWPTDPPIYDYPSTNDYGFSIDRETEGTWEYEVTWTFHPTLIPYMGVSSSFAG